ncbi:MAG: hypothetical protein JWR84_2487 [Caulobacter sp.]|nr:hypothetical protein [Caulobacter sp.]
MTFRFLRDGVWLCLNGMAALIFLWLSSSQWIEPELRGYPGASGGAPVIFALIVAQLLGPLLLLNLIWLGLAAWKSLPQRDWTPVWAFAGMAVGWIGLIHFSASRV